jgi:hypothetical protein
MSREEAEKRIIELERIADVDLVNLEDKCKALELKVTETERLAQEKIEATKKNVEAECRAKRLALENTNKELTRKLEEMSRQASLTAVSPITDVLEHPIVKNTMTKLSTRAQQLLIKIEREPSLNREQLAAFLTSSKDVVANVIAEINRTFKAEVIVDDGGRPIKYRSMLQRLYITDVAKREINRIEELEHNFGELKESHDSLKERFRVLQSDKLALEETLKHRPTYEEFAKIQEERKTLTADLKQSTLQFKKQEQAIRLADRIFSSIEQLAKEANKFRLVADVAPLVAETAVLPEKAQSTTEVAIGTEGLELGRTLMAPDEHGTPAAVDAVRNKLTPHPFLDFALREKMIAFLQKHPKVLFTEDELVLALGENKLFHETYLSLDDCAVLEVTDQGVRAK